MCDSIVIGSGISRPTAAATINPALWRHMRS
jgi:hypothetical protein